MVAMMSPQNSLLPNPDIEETPWQNKQFIELLKSSRRKREKRKETPRHEKREKNKNDRVWGYYLRVLWRGMIIDYSSPSTFAFIWKPSTFRLSS